MASARLFNRDIRREHLDGAKDCPRCEAASEGARRRANDLDDVFRRIHDLHKILLRSCVDYEPIEVLEDVTRLLRESEVRDRHPLVRSRSSDTASQRSTPDLLLPEVSSSPASKCLAHWCAKAEAKDIAVQVCVLCLWLDQSALRSDHHRVRSQMDGIADDEDFFSSPPNPTEDLQADFLYGSDDEDSVENRDLRAELSLRSTLRKSSSTSALSTLCDGSPSPLRHVGMSGSFWRVSTAMNSRLKDLEDQLQWYKEREEKARMLSTDGIVSCASGVLSKPPAPCPCVRKLPSPDEQQAHCLGSEVSAAIGCEGEAGSRTQGVGNEQRERGVEDGNGRPLRSRRLDNCRVWLSPSRLVTF